LGRVSALRSEVDQTKTEINNGIFFLFENKTNKQTNNQTNKLISKQINKIKRNKTSKQTDK
jgi:hypothetical protein